MLFLNCRVYKILYCQVWTRISDLSYFVIHISKYNRLLFIFFPFSSFNDPPTRFSIPSRSQWFLCFSSIVQFHIFFFRLHVQQSPTRATRTSPRDLYIGSSISSFFWHGKFDFSLQTSDEHSETQNLTTSFMVQEFFEFQIIFLFAAWIGVVVEIWSWIISHHGTAQKHHQKHSRALVRKI